MTNSSSRETDKRTRRISYTIYLHLKSTSSHFHSPLVCLPLRLSAGLRCGWLFPSTEAVSEASPESVHSVARRPLPPLKKEKSQSKLLYVRYFSFYNKKK